MFMRDVRRSGRSFLERGCILEHQICRFAKMILRDRRSTLERCSRKIAKRIGTRLSALHSTFHFWRKSRKIVFFFDVVKFKKLEKSRRIALFWMLSNAKKWRSLADLFRFGCCYVQKLTELLSLQACRILQIDRETDRQREREREIDR